VFRVTWACLIMGAILVCAFALDISYGDTQIPVGKVLKTVQQHLVGAPVPADDLLDTIVWDIRFPRALRALLVGAILAMSGAALQGLLLNPLADPYTVGVSSGAALGAGIAMLLGLEAVAWGYGVPLVAFVFAMAAMSLVYFLARSAGRVSIHSFLLAGVVVGSFLWALLSFVLALASGNPAQVQSQIVIWLLGSFDRGDSWAMVRLCAPFAILGVGVLTAFARDLNVFAMGEESARSLGIETETFKIVIIVIASLITSAAVAVSGIIGFVGLVVPHTCRKLFGADHRVLIPASALAGGSLTLFADLVSRAILPPSGLPVGVVTAMLGAPFFLYLLKCSQK